MRLVGLEKSCPGELPLHPKATRIGSDASNELTIPVATVSRQHALIRRRIGGYCVEDLGSTNGTFVNERRVIGSMSIKPGDELRFGTARFVLRTNARLRAARRTIRNLVLIFLLCAGAGFAALEFSLSRGLVGRPQAAAFVRHWRNELRSGAESVAAGRLSDGTDAGSRSSPAWLKRLNYYRAMAGVPLVRADPKLSEGDAAHARYLVKNFSDAIKNGTPLDARMHREKPDSPWYSAAGAAAARSSDVAQWFSSGGTKFSAAAAIDGWISIPFHRLPLLSRRLKAAGYGAYCEHGVCAAALNVMTDATAMRPRRVMASAPVAFVPDGATIHLHDSQGEWPDPLTSCPGFSAPSGLPVTLQFGSWIAPRLAAYSIIRDGQQLAACGFDASDYANPRPVEQQLGREVLRDYGAVVLIPRTALTPGKYEIAMTVDGRKYRWSFTMR